MNEPRNLYQLQDFFRLLIGGTVQYFDEPVKWKEAAITAERDKDLNYEFIDPNIVLIFPFDEGGDQIQAEYESFGGDAIIGFEYGYTQGGVKKVQFKGNLNFNTYKRLDEGIEIAIEKTVFSSLIRTRFETKVSMNAVADLDGKPIVPPAPFPVRLHSKEITKYARAVQQPEQAEGFAPLLMPASGFWIQPDSTNIETQEAETMFALPPTVTALSPVSDLRYQFESSESGLATVKFAMDYTISETNTTGRIKNWELRPFIQVFRGGTQLRIYELPSQYLSGFTNSTILVQNHVFALEFKIQLEPLDQIYFSIFHFSTNSNIVTYWANKILMEVKIESVAPESTCNGYKILDAANHVVRALTGKEGAVRSSFFGPDGCGEKYILTSGFQIRNFDIANKPVQISLQDIFEGISPIWMIGIQYSIDDAGNDIMFIEPIPDFIGTERIVDITELSDYDEAHSKDFTFNEGEIGYQKFAEGDLNTLDEFNTFRTWLFPIKTFKNKYSKKSRFIASGYSIETMRREQFKSNPSTSLSLDDDIFIIAWVLGRNHSGVTFSTSGPFIEFGKPLGLKKDDQFSIQGGNGANLNVSFTVLSRDYTATERYRIAPDPSPDQGVADILIVSIIATSERNEVFSTIENLISPATAYNLRISPEIMLHHHSPLLNVGLWKKGDAEEIKQTFAKSNGIVKFKFGESATCNPFRVNKLMDSAAPIPLIDYNLRERLFLPITASFTCPLNYDIVAKLRDALTGRLSGADAVKNYGTISFPDDQGQTWEGVVLAFEYQPFEEICSFKVQKVKRLD